MLFFAFFMLKPVHWRAHTMHGWRLTNNSRACHEHILLFHDDFHRGKLTAKKSLKPRGDFNCFRVKLNVNCCFVIIALDLIMQVRHLNETLLKHQAIPHPGIGPILPNDEIQHHAYYQWVPFVLFAQAISFYLPHLFWRTWEGGRIKTLVIGLQLVLLSKHLKSEDDMRFKSDMVILSKPTLDKKVRHSQFETVVHRQNNLIKLF